MSRNSNQRKDALRLYGPAVLLVIVGFVVAYQFIKPAPPSRVVIATGSEQGAYHAFARRYSYYLAKEGVELVLRPSAGSLENRKLLREGRVDVAFVQGGTSGPEDREADLRSLGSLYYEPLWLFHRKGLDLKRIGDLRGRRVAIGGLNSGTAALVRRLLGMNGMSTSDLDARELGGGVALSALRTNQVDAAFFVMSPRSELVSQALADSTIEVASLSRADAYARRERYLSVLTLPEGSVDLARNIPDKNVRLLAPTANLVAGPDLHPAIAALLLMAADKVHGAGGWFEASGQFPAPTNLEYPLSEDADRFYKHGPPFLQRFMPFWAASLVDRLKVMLLPLIVLLLPFFKLMPPIYNWRMNSRIYRWYEELDDVDVQTHGGLDEEKRKALTDELERIEADVREVHVPLAFANQLYTLREHIALVRYHLEQGQG